MHHLIAQGATITLNTAVIITIVAVLGFMLTVLGFLIRIIMLGVRFDQRLREVTHNQRNLGAVVISVIERLGDAQLADLLKTSFHRGRDDDLLGG